MNCNGINLDSWTSTKASGEVVCSLSAAKEATELWLVGGPAYLLANEK